MKYLGNPQSGSQAHTTASHNRAGQYFRSRRTPVNAPGTGRKAIVRANFGTSAKAYAALTGPQQAAWTSYAASYPITDSLGQSITLTGQQIFISISANLLNCLTTINNAPPISNAVFNANPISVGVNSSGALIVTPNGTGNADDFLLLAFSQQKSSGVNFCKTFWQAFVSPGNNDSPNDISVQYVAQFGLPATGQRIFYKATPINAYGVAGVPVISFVSVINYVGAPILTPGAAGIVTWIAGGSVGANWLVYTSSDSGATWDWQQTVPFGTLTAVGLPSADLCRIVCADASNSPTSQYSNTVTVV